MTGQHTPGPWRLADHGYTYIVSGGDGFITRDIGRDVPCRMDGSTMAAFEQRANAYLIAAAPCLLAELHNARSILVDLEDWPASSPNIVSIDAAISKAEGRT